MSDDQPMDRDAAVGPDTDAVPVHAAVAPVTRAAPADVVPDVSEMTATARPPRLAPLGRTIGHVGLALTVAFGGLALGAGYWQVVRSPELTTDPGNPLVIAAARNVVRGQIVDRDGKVLASNARDKATGQPYRVYSSDDFSAVLGYSSRQFGTAGLERAFNAELSGVSNGNPIGDALRKFELDPYDPQKLTLSLSSQLQRAAVDGLGSDRGAVVMLDPRTGEVLAMASTPTFDNGAVANPTTAEKAFSQLRVDKSQPLLNRATQGLYVPGSVFKIVTAIAGLASGRVQADTTFPQQPKAEKDGLVVSGFRVREHAGVPSRSFDLAAATEWSSNIWYALAGLRTGGQDLADVAGRMGFGKPLAFDLPTVRSQVSGGGGGPGGFADEVELANAAYGQAKTLVTPLQMALVASTVANGGILMQPHLVIAESGRGGTRTVGEREMARVLSPDDAAAIGRAMQRAVESSVGRQFTTGAKVPGVPTAGKSGTAELGGSGAPHSWFIGFAPVRNPQVAIAVIVERGGRGGARAAPLAGDLLQRYFELNP
ncbi:MAG TPA: penicillin-binding transpeptidase domain-containing protein [Candidatus Limnocylindrales bacterium]